MRQSNARLGLFWKASFYALGKDSGLVLIQSTSGLTTEFHDDYSSATHSGLSIPVLFFTYFRSLLHNLQASLFFFVFLFRDNRRDTEPFNLFRPWMVAVDHVRVFI